MISHQIAQNVYDMYFGAILITFIDDLKIDLITVRPPDVKLFFFYDVTLFFMNLTYSSAV